MKIFIILTIVLFTIFSGCEGANTSPINPAPPPPDPKPAQDAIVQAQSFMQSVQSDLSVASGPINDAKSKGVETTSSDALISTLQSKLSNAANILNSASTEFNNQNYPQAKLDAEQSITIMQDVQNQLGQIQQFVQNDYKTTADKYKPQLIEAEKQYRIGEKLIESVQKLDTDISVQQVNLQNALTELNQAKESYRNNNFIGLLDQINRIVEISQNVQKELTDIYIDTLIKNATNNAESQISSEEGMAYISDATSLRNQKKYNESIIAINKALATENKVDISKNIDKLKQAVSDMGINASFKILDDRLVSIVSHIENADFDLSKKDLYDIKSDIITISESSANVADANNIVEDTSKLSFYWAEKPDTSASRNKLNEAKIFLLKGDYMSAADAANNTVDLANNERKAFWSNVRSDYILGPIHDVSNLLMGDPEIYDPKSVIRPNFEWKAIREYVNVDFSKDIVDVNNIVIEDPGLPISPTIQQVQTATIPKKPIYFELNPGNPTSCGNTCRQTVATLTNTGDEDAHNVKVNLNIYNNIDESVYSTQESIGDVSAGKSISKTITINADCGSILSLYSKCRDHMPLKLKAEVIFDEGSQMFPVQQFGG